MLVKILDRLQEAGTVNGNVSLIAKGIMLGNLSPLRFLCLGLLRTIGHIARSKGMTRIAKELNLDRVGLYKSFAPDGNPSFRTVFKLLDILGLRIKVEPKSA